VYACCQTHKSLLRGEAFVPGTTAEADGEDSDGYWWWQPTEARAAKWVVPQWEVLAEGRVGWEGSLKKVRVNERRSSGEHDQNRSRVGRCLCAETVREA
jgi:hypothetical protein